MEQPLVRDIGHIVLQVENMEQALRLYRDALGFEVVEERSEAIWTIIRTKGGELTLYATKNPRPLVLRGEDEEDTLINLHVHNFEEAAAVLEKAGYTVYRRSRHGGTLLDPWGNLIALHDHRQG